MTPTAERESARPDKIYEVHASGLEAILTTLRDYEEELRSRGVSIQGEELTSLHAGKQLFEKLAKPKLKQVIVDQFAATETMRILVFELADCMDVTLRPIPLEDGPNEGQLWGVDISSERLEESKAIGIEEFESLFDLGHSPDNMEAMLSQMKEEWNQGRSVNLKRDDS